MDQSTSRKRDVRLILGAVGISALGDFLLAASSAEPELAG